MKLTDKQVKEIEEFIIIGAKKAYHQNLVFTGQYISLQSRIIENLVTINIAQSLLDWIIKNRLQIHLEYPIKDFYNGAFPTMKLDGDSIFNTTFKERNEHKPSNNKLGRIDIVIAGEPHNEGYYSNPQNKSLIGIEIKSITKSKQKVIADIIRVFKALTLVDPIESNSINQGYSVFFRRLDNPNKIINEKQILKKRKKEIEYWENVFKGINTDSDKYVFEIQETIIEESPIEKISSQFDQEDTEYSEIIDNSGLVVCYLIKIKRK